MKTKGRGKRGGKEEGTTSEGPGLGTSRPVCSRGRVGLGKKSPSQRLSTKEGMNLRSGCETARKIR